MMKMMMTLIWRNGGLQIINGNLNKVRWVANSRMSNRSEKCSYEENTDEDIEKLDKNI
jgi:hypothetical protein